MNIAVVARKGGVGKTTTSVHLAALLQMRGRTVLVDGDPNQSAAGWASRGHLPFTVSTDPREARGYAHVVVDTAARPSSDDLRAIADRCDLLVLPTSPDALALDALRGTIETLTALHITRYRVLLTLVPPRPSHDGDEARVFLRSSGVPLCRGRIRRFVAFQKAALTGCLVHEVTDPRAAWGWADYTAIGKELLR